MYPAGVGGISTKRVAVRSGLSLRVLEAGSPDGEPVVLVHGWGGNVYSWAETIPALAKSGFRVVAFDLPGHGLSDKPIDGKMYTTRSLSGTVSSVAKALGIDAYTYVGHSMAGEMGLDLVLNGDRRIRRLVLIASVGLGTVPLIAPLRLLSPAFVDRFTPALLTRGVLRNILRFAYGSKDRPTERDIEEYWAPSQFPEFARACRACVHNYTWRRTTGRKLRSLGLPVLVISGRRDRIIRADGRRGRMIPGARVVRLHDGGHLAMQECANAVNAELLGFLRSGEETGVAPTHYAI